MGQSWLIVDLDARKTLGGGGKLGEWFWRSTGSSIMDALRVPAPNPKVDELLRGTETDQLASALLRLSQELYDFVLDELENVDYIALLSCAVTCKAALARSRRHIEAHQRRCAPALAGHRIICVGEYADGLSELPPGMLTAEEEEELRGDEDTSSLWAYALEYFRNYDKFSLFMRDKPTQLLNGRGHYFVPQRWCREDWTRAVEVGAAYYPAEQPWALCNLTKREYVNKDAAEEVCKNLPDSGFGPHDPHPCAWHFLLASICWSPDSSYNMPYDEDDLAKGGWAGDRFAIHLLDSLPPAAHGEGAWKDVTDEVGALVKRVWAAECDG